MKSEPLVVRIDDNDYPKLKRRLVILANENNKSLTSDFAEVMAIVNGADVVFGIWQDRSEPDGIGMMIVKGEAFIRGAAAEGTASAEYRVNAISCNEYEQAVALAEHIEHRNASTVVGDRVLDGATRKPKYH